LLKSILPASALFLLTLLTAPLNPPIPTDDAPAYNPKGDLIAPPNYREWIYLTSGIDMSYASSAAPPDHHMFDNVFVNPSSYRSFLATGTWPDKTTFVLETRGADSPISINKRGHTQSVEVMGHELHVKDRGVWKFYDQPGNSTVANLIPRPADCYTCHEAHAAVDTTFVQFYPTLFPIAQQKKTLSTAYLKELDAPAK
jgi:hypothetical protein